METIDTLKSSSRKYAVILAALGAALFIPFIGGTHLFDWDEINFAESAREMIVTGNYARVQINYQPFWEKPPLFFWMQTVSMKLFGVTDFAARLPNAIIGVFTLLALYLIGSRLKGPRFGLLWSILYIGSLLPFVYFKTGVIDPTFNFFIFLSVYFLSETLRPENKERSLRFAILAGLMAGLGTLTKGPVALLLVLLTFLVYWSFNRFGKIARIKDILAFAVVYAMTTVIWFGLELIENGPWFLVEFVSYQIDLFLNPVAGHKQPIYYHFVVVFFGCFPISILALPAFRKNKTGDEPYFTRWMKILFWVVMILFTIVTTKIVHYSSQAWFPLSFLAAWQVNRYIEAGSMPKWAIWIITVLGLVLALTVASVSLLPIFQDQLQTVIKDRFIVACLNTEIIWSGFEFLPGLLWVIGIVYSIIQLHKNKIRQGLFALSLSTGICLCLCYGMILPKVERIIQGPTITFYQSLIGKDVYLHSVKFHSYGIYYYSMRQPGQKPEASNREWLLTGPIDKPAYFATKVTAREYFKKFPDVKLIKEEGGFLFFERLPKVNP